MSNNLINLAQTIAKVTATAVLMLVFWAVFAGLAIVIGGVIGI